LANGYLDPYGLTIVELRTSVFRLCTDQFSAGYSVVICKRHVVEPTELPPDEQSGFWADVVTAGRAVQSAFGVDKMNYLMLGNDQPHLHCHLVPRRHGDPGAGRPWLPAQPQFVPAEVLADRAARIRARV